MLTLEPKAISISKPSGKLPIQIPLEVTISPESSAQLGKSDRVDKFRALEESSRVRDDVWKVYLALKQEREEVYRRLANS